MSKRYEKYTREGMLKIPLVFERKEGMASISMPKEQKDELKKMAKKKKMRMYALVATWMKLHP